MRTFLIIMGVLIVFGGVAVGGYVFEWWAAPWKGKLEQRKEVQSGDVRRVSYEKFHELYTKMRSIQRKIETQEQQLETTESSNRRDQIRANITALKAQLSDVVAKYNAMANKKTVGQFRDVNLPAKVNYPPKDLPSMATPH